MVIAAPTAKNLGMVWLVPDLAILRFGFSQPNDAAYFIGIEDEHHGVIDVRSLVPAWHIEADGILSLFGLVPRRTMGRLALQKTETIGYAIYVKELQERCKRVQDSSKSTAEAGNSRFENLSECNETHEVIEEQVSGEHSTQHSDNFEKHSDNAQWSLPWRAVDKSPLFVFNTDTTSSATVDTSPTILLRHLHQLIWDVLTWKLHRFLRQRNIIPPFKFALRICMDYTTWETWFGRQCQETEAWLEDPYWSSHRSNTGYQHASPSSVLGRCPHFELPTEGSSRLPKQFQRNDVQIHWILRDCRALFDSQSLESWNKRDIAPLTAS